MKNMRKLFAMVLAIIMVMSLATTAFATMEGELTGGSITINDAVSGQTYKAYQILYLESYDSTANTYAYKANSAWAEWLATCGYVSIDDQGYVTWVNGKNVADFAKAAQAQLTGKTADAIVTATSASVVMNDLKLGYYLVDTTLGSLCSLNTTKPNAIIEEKNEAPTVTKKVQEDSNSNWGVTNDADINQTVNFKSTITVQKGAENYILHDTMSEGLTYTGVTSVKIGTADVAADNYKVTAPGKCGCTFEVAFDNEYVASLAAGTVIVVEYAATLNEKAVVGLSGNDNDIKLQYGDESKPSYTPEETTTTYTWDMEVLKYANGDRANVLAGVEFVLLNKEKTQVATVVNGKLTGWAAVPAAGADGSITWPANAVLTTDANGEISIDGLDADTYYLRETKALPGYNKLAGDVEVKVNAATTGDNDELTYTTVVTEVENKSGTELPTTGGMGTTLFYIFGGILMVGAAVLLVTKKRMASAE